MNKSYKFRIYPNQKQEIQIQKTFGSCRFIYNYYLDKRIKIYENDKTTFNYYDCCNRHNLHERIKRSSRITFKAKTTKNR